MKRVEKPWGYELWWAVTDRYVGKLIHVNKGHALRACRSRAKDDAALVLAWFRCVFRGRKRRSRCARAMSRDRSSSTAEPSRRVSLRTSIRGGPGRQREEAEAPQMERVGHLAHQRLVAPAGAGLDHHQADVAGHRLERAAMMASRLVPVDLKRRQH